MLVTRLAADHLGKHSKVTAVLIEPAPPGSWFVASHNSTSLGLSTFWLTIAITTGTNVKAEPAVFIRAAAAEMQDLLGWVREQSYVLVKAVDRNAYSYGGRTQSARWQKLTLGDREHDRESLDAATGHSAMRQRRSQEPVRRTKCQVREI